MRGREQLHLVDLIADAEVSHHVEAQEGHERRAAAEAQRRGAHEDLGREEGPTAVWFGRSKGSSAEMWRARSELLSTPIFFMHFCRYSSRMDTSVYESSGA